MVRPFMPEDAETRLRLDLPLLVLPGQENAVAAAVERAKRELALLEFQMTLHALARHWPEGLLSLSASVHADPALGRLSLHLRTGPMAGSASDHDSSDAFREKMDTVCENTGAYWAELVQRAFENGTRWVTHIELPTLLWAGVANDPHATARLRAAELSDAFPSFSKDTPRPRI